MQGTIGSLYRWKVGFYNVGDKRKPAKGIVGGIGETSRGRAERRLATISLMLTTRCGGAPFLQSTILTTAVDPAILEI